MLNKYLVYLVLLFISNSLIAQNCEVPQVLIDEYEKDVKHLTLLRMELLNAEELDFIEISQTWQDTIWEGLAAIFNSESEARDAVFDQYCIHHNSWTSSNYLRISESMNIRLDTNAAWFQDWEDGNIITNNDLIDALTQTYGFDSVRYSLPFIQVFTIYTDQYLNLNPLADSLELDSNIIFAERATAAGESSRISYQLIDGDRYFDFSIGWGDCPAGCTAFYTWSFKVDEDCQVFFLGEQGDAVGMPDPINCNITTGSNLIGAENIRPIAGYPNPTTGEFIIELESNQNFDLTSFEIYNSLGDKVSNGELARDKSISLTFLPAGFYVILLKDSQMNRYLTKVIKL